MAINKISTKNDVTYSDLYKTMMIFKEFKLFSIYV